MMKFGKNGNPLNVYKTDTGRWRADARTTAGHRYIQTFNTWHAAIAFANSVFLTYEISAFAPSTHAVGFSEWKIRPGINVRTNHQAKTIVLTAGKGREVINDTDEALDLSRALLSAALQIRIGEASNV